MAVVVCLVGLNRDDRLPLSSLSVPADLVLINVNLLFHSFQLLSF